MHYRVKRTYTNADPCGKIWFMVVVVVLHGDSCGGAGNDGGEDNGWDGGGGDDDGDGEGDLMGILVDWLW